jgi:hypothetical protein
VSLTRRSSGLALANFGLWVVFGHHDRLTFLVHPQLWLVPAGSPWPPSRSTATGCGRRRPWGCATRVRCWSTPSTADMFLTGLGRGVQLPIALALLSVAGVLLGTPLRLRAFLFLGVTSLSLGAFAQVWSAVGRSQAWAWWASGIPLVTAILTLFALVEKRRNDVLRVLDAARRWR